MPLCLGAEMEVEVELPAAVDNDQAALPPPPSPTTLTDYLRQARDNMVALVELMGTRFMLLLSLLTHVNKGFVFGGGKEGLVGTPILFLFRQYGTLTAAQIQIQKTIACSPWTLKPLFGMLSDTLTIGGYNKLPYIIATTVAAAVACVVLAFVAPLSPTALTLLLFVIFTQCSVSDLLIEAKYTQKIKGNETLGPTLTSFNQTGMAIAGFLVILLCGLLITHVPLNYIYLLPLTVFCAIVYAVDDNWLDDEEFSWHAPPIVTGSEEVMQASGRVVTRPVRLYRRLLNLCCGHCAYRQPDEPDTPVWGFDRAKVAAHRRLFVLSSVIVGISLLTSAIGLLGLPPVWLFIIALLSTVLMIAALFTLMEDRRMAMIQTYVILQAACGVSTGAADFFFYTDTAAQYPEGPHFSTFFYVTVMGLVATALHLVGVQFYYVFMSHWRFRTVLYVSNTMLMLFSLPMIVLVKRWNVALGLPDWLFVLGTEALQVVTSAWSDMPIGLVMFQLSPAGVEATAFAMLAGSSNMGHAVGNYIGAYLLDAFGVGPTGAANETAQFANLWAVYVIATVLPLIPLASIRFLIPDRSQKESLLLNDEEVK